MPTLPAVVASSHPSNATGGHAGSASLDSGWQAGDAGLELRRTVVPVPSSGVPATMLELRLDLSRVRLHIGYAPGQPRQLREWRDETNALAVVNGGFFTPEYTALGLTVSEGQADGSSRESGGMFAIDTAGVASIRDLGRQPYDDSEQFAEVLQSFPLLVRPGGEAGQIEESGERARRSAVAIDDQGRVLLIVTTSSVWTLQDFADALAASDLQIERALNLDGGSSTGMIVRSGPLEEQVLPLSPLPQVLIVERK